jgi:hypothetical protein
LPPIAFRQPCRVIPDSRHFIRKIGTVLGTRPKAVVFAHLRSGFGRQL